MALSPFRSVSACGYSFPRPRGTLNTFSYLRHLLTEHRRSTGEIDELYERKIPAWRWGRTVTAIEEQMQAAVRARPAGQALDNEKA
jgi:hypothetical protein